MVTRAPDRIIDAALIEFTEHGIAGARLDQIVRRAGVSRQLFYYYFKSKEEIYEHILEAAAEKSINLVLQEDCNHASAEASIRHFFTLIFNQYIEMPFLIQFTLDQDYHRGAHITLRNKMRSLLPVLVDRLGFFLQQGEANNEFRAGIDPEFFYTATMLMLRGCFVSSSTAALMQRLHLERHESLIAWRENCIELALSGIRLPSVAKTQKNPSALSLATKRTA
jgi:AcrR family transcriptional regulator